MSTTADPSNCCDQIIAQGCLNNGNPYVLADHGDGTYTLYDAFTGLVANPADVVDCPEDTNITVFTDFFLATPWSTQFLISANGSLVHWHVKCITTPITISVNGSASVNMDEDEEISSTAQDGRRLNDSVFLTLSGAGRAHITVTRDGGA